MRVLCIEGVHGVGKSTLISKLGEMGYDVRHENFNYASDSVMHKQGLFMELKWVQQWFSDVIESYLSGKKLLIMDRSPFSAHFYAKTQFRDMVLGVAKEEWAEVQATLQITFETVCLTLDSELLWGRITNRMKKEPARQQCAESSRRFMDETVAAYTNFQWDHVLVAGDNVAEEVKRLFLY